LDEWRRITLADVLHIAKTIENLCQFKESNWAGNLREKLRGVW
jgi:hypothetical protein